MNPTNGLLTGAMMGKVNGYGLEATRIERAERAPEPPSEPPSPLCGKRVVISRVGGPDVKPSAYFFAGHVVALDLETVTINLGPGLWIHMFSLETGQWLRGPSAEVEDCVLDERAFVELRDATQPGRLQQRG